VGNDPDVPSEWDVPASTEPPAQLLRRAISHVESLLHRLENPAEQPAVAAPAESESAVVVDLAKPAHVSEPEETAALLSLSGVSSTAQAEALRITLHAHEEAHRVRAEAAAEGERILVEARMLSDRLHIESRDTASELLAAAKDEAAAIIEAARAEAGRIRRDAHEESRTARAELDARAEQERMQAHSAALAEAEREADQIRTRAQEQARAEAARLVEAEVTAAAEEGRRAVEESRGRAADLLVAANRGVDDVRTMMRELIDGLEQSLVGFNSAVASVEGLRDAIGELTPPEEHEEDLEETRPLGLLFGAQRG
jgi:vacuolar-type H+-ATPase subunit E/Vma4